MQLEGMPVFASTNGITGRPTFAANFAKLAPEGSPYVALDVREPNGRVLLNPGITHISDCEVCVPRVYFQFNALAVPPKSVTGFGELYHDCGGCSAACPRDMIGFGINLDKSSGRPLTTIRPSSRHHRRCVFLGLSLGEYSI